jgi:hypothetical protein
MKPYPALLPPLLDSPPYWFLLHHWLQTRSSALSSPNCSLVDQQRVHPSMFLARAGDQELLLSPGKPDGLVWNSVLFGFLALRPSCTAGGRHTRNGYLLHSSLHGQNPQQVLTNPGGSASAMVPMVHTTAPKEDKVDTSSAEVPTDQALATRLGCKALDDNLANDDPGPLNFDVVESEILCWTSS